MEKKLAELGWRLGNRKRVRIRDWNAYHKLWVCEGTQNNTWGRQLAE